MKPLSLALIFASAISLFSNAAMAQSGSGFLPDPARDGITKDKGPSQDEKCLKGIEEAYSANHLRHPFIYSKGVLVVKTPKGPVAYSAFHQMNIVDQGVTYDRGRTTKDGVELLLKDFSEKVDDSSLKKNQSSVNGLIPCMVFPGSESQGWVKGLLIRAGLFKASDVKGVINGPHQAPSAK